jgi:hypothetical protein
VIQGSTTHQKYRLFQSEFLNAIFDNTCAECDDTGLQKKVPKKWFVIMAISYHLNGSTETHLKKVNGYQENGCGHLSPRPREK